MSDKKEAGKDGKDNKDKDKQTDKDKADKSKDVKDGDGEDSKEQSNPMKGILNDDDLGDDKDDGEKTTGSKTPSAANANKKKKKVVVKVGMVGDAQIGKTSLMVKYVEGNFNEDYIQTLGVNFMEKTIALRNTDITFSIWDLGGQQEYLHMLPLVCNDAVALLFMFDLSRKSTLTSVKNWYKQARILNKTATPFLIGTKFDYFANLKQEEKVEITTQAQKFAKAMKAPLIFCSASHSINVQKIFKVVLSKVFDLKCSVKKISTVGDPIIMY
jgi:GTP-binding protein of the ras superfamily involved in termination of M-phase